MATYTPNVPVSGQSLGNSRTIINSNFSAIQTTFDENHQDFNSSNPGFHTFVDLLSQGTTPSNPPTGAISHYSNIVNGITEWFFQRENSGAVIQMSNGTPLASTNGQTFLPGGLILKFARVNVVQGDFGATITFTTAFPNNAFVAIGSISGLSVSSTNNYTFSTPSLTQFAVLFNSAVSNNLTKFSGFVIGN